MTISQYDVQYIYIYKLQIQLYIIVTKNNQHQSQISTNLILRYVLSDKINSMSSSHHKDYSSYVSD